MTRLPPTDPAATVADQCAKLMQTLHPKLAPDSPEYIKLRDAFYAGYMSAFTQINVITDLEEQAAIDQLEKVRQELFTFTFDAIASVSPEVAAFLKPRQ